MSDDIVEEAREFALDARETGLSGARSGHCDFYAQALADRDGLLLAAAFFISRLEADEQEAKHVIAEVERLTAKNPGGV